MRIPPIRIVERGRPNDAALDLIFANMRGMRERQGDFQAMVGTCRKAAERIEALAARYGAATVREAVAELMDRAEARMRRAIGALPDGTYVYEAHLESGRERLEPLTVRAQVIVAGDDHHRRPHRHRRRRRRGPPTSAPPWRRPAPSRSSSPSSIPGSRRQLRRLPPAHRHHAARHHRQRQSPARRAAAWSR